MHGARLGIDLAGVLMRIGDVRNPARCSLRPGAEDWVIRSLGDTSVHIISRGGRSGTEWRLREFRRSLGCMARTGVIADNVHFRRTRSGTHGKGTVFRQVNPYGHQRPDAKVGDASF